MERIKLNLDKSKKYVVACSFGPDSMALLDAAIKEKLNIVVAHVNYRKRDVSVFEQESLTKYCNERNVSIFVLDLIGQKAEGNFQGWARRKRYEFFADVLRKEGAYAVLVAHNEDDLIETYLMQKNRGNFVKNYGISEENEIFGVKIIRPLLGFSKQFLQEYDDKNNVPYSIDESNLSDVYARNKIRHSVVQKMSKDERNEIVNQINKNLMTKVEYKTKFIKKEFLSLDYYQIILLLDHFMQKMNEHKDISERFVGEIKKSFKSKTTQRFKITNNLWLELDYGNVYLINSSKIKSYKNTFTKSFKNDFLNIDFSNGAEDRNINNANEEYIVKNCNKSDTLIIKDYTSQIRRLFIDWKMPLFIREIWPGIYDKNDSLIYVPRYREKFIDEHKSKFKIDINYFLKF